MFSTNFYSTIRSVDKLILVDIYLSGCPPKPKVITDAITKLYKKTSREIYKVVFPFIYQKKEYSLKPELIFLNI